MTAIAIVAVLFALVVASKYFVREPPGRPSRKPLWTAFTLTAVALLYGVGGLLGYVVPRHNPFIGRVPVWVGHIVWPQVGWAAVTLLASVPFWWQGLKRLAEESPGG